MGVVRRRYSRRTDNWVYCRVQKSLYNIQEELWNPKGLLGISKNELFEYPVLTDITTTQVLLQQKDNLLHLKQALVRTTYD
jgi:hypothetical protein